MKWNESTKTADTMKNIITGWFIVQRASSEVISFPFKYAKNFPTQLGRRLAEFESH